MSAVDTARLLAQTTNNKFAKENADTLSLEYFSAPFANRAAPLITFLLTLWVLALGPLTLRSRLIGPTG